MSNMQICRYAKLMYNPKKYIMDTHMNVCILCIVFKPAFLYYKKKDAISSVRNGIVFSSLQRSLIPGILYFDVEL